MGSGASEEQQPRPGPETARQAHGGLRPGDADQRPAVTATRLPYRPHRRQPGVREGPPVGQNTRATLRRRGRKKG